AYVVNVGDSRMYVIYNGKITQVTHDHSYVQYFIDQGKMTVEEARKSKNKNLITRAVGIEKTVGADLFSHDMPNGSYALLCSDGLSNLIEPEEIIDIVRTPQDSDSAERVCDNLISEANRRGGNDNITAVLLAV
ncbi:MAG: serine/threonine-protein phosphatase, partial [Eubacteriales bacterium]